MRLIDADSLGKSLTKKVDDYKVSMFATSDECNIARIVAFECAKEVRNAPTIKAVPVRHGRWIEDGGCNTCSLCGNSFAMYDGRGHYQDFYYCPKCGQPMDAKDMDVPTTQMDGGADG